MEVIELLLDVKIKRIEYKDDDHNIQITSDSKGIRVDVYLADEDGTVFDLEMQNPNKKELPKRARYYQSVIDRDNLRSGASYKRLPKSYIVFICTFDLYEKGLPKYEFRELCLDDPYIELGDETTKVFINAESKSKDITGEMRAFLNYLCGKGAESDLTKNIESEIIQAKAEGKWEKEYMTLEDLIREEKEDSYEEGRVEGHAEGLMEGREEGRAEGRVETRFEDVDALVAEGTFDAARACEILGVDFAAYEEHVKENA